MRLPARARGGKEGTRRELRAATGVGGHSFFFFHHSFFPSWFATYLLLPHLPDQGVGTTILNDDCPPHPTLLYCSRDAGPAHPTRRRAARVALRWDASTAGKTPESVHVLLSKESTIPSIRRGSSTQTFHGFPPAMVIVRGGRLAFRCGKKKGGGARAHASAGQNKHSPGMSCSIHHADDQRIGAFDAQMSCPMMLMIRQPGTIPYPGSSRVARSIAYHTLSWASLPPLASLVGLGRCIGGLDTPQSRSTTAAEVTSFGMGLKLGDAPWLVGKHCVTGCDAWKSLLAV
ncbi:hypothetical protein LZ30DRAFT_239993 [Colletotrichum cereale]|nr:hypothetical protein LZ30DRAFT_239993 [Colletotrichum cereale]